MYTPKRHSIFIIQSGAKSNIFKIDFLIFIFIKIQRITYQIKHNWINSMMVKTVSKIILQLISKTALKKHES